MLLGCFPGGVVWPAVSEALAQVVRARDSGSGPYGTPYSYQSQAGPPGGGTSVRRRDRRQGQQGGPLVSPGLSLQQVQSGLVSRRPLIFCRWHEILYYRIA